MQRPSNRPAFTLLRGGEITGNKINRCAHRPGHDGCERPVAGDLEIQIVGVQLVDVMPQVHAETFAAELGELVPVRVFRFFRNIGDTGLLPEELQHVFTVIAHRGPAFAIDPDAVDTVHIHQFLHLRDEELVRVWTEHGGLVRIGLAIFVHTRPIGMLFAGFGVPDSGIVEEERHSARGGDIAPDTELIADESRSGVADFRGIAAESPGGPCNRIGCNRGERRR